MALRIPDWLIEADEYPWQTRLTFAAVWGPDMREGRIPERVLARKTLLSPPRTIRPALDWLADAGWIERERGHSTATANPVGKLHATGKLLAVNPVLLTGSFTVIGAEVYDRLDTAVKRWSALRHESRKRAVRGFVTFGTDAEVEERTRALTVLRDPHIQNVSLRRTSAQLLRDGDDFRSASDPQRATFFQEQERLVTRALPGRDSLDPSARHRPPPVGVVS